MSTEKSHADKTSADDKSIGFDYQYYYFLDRILCLKSGQSAGLEVKDDVHSEINANFNILYQVKHTVQKNSTGAPIALTELDSDLWKTLYNWSKIICDETQGRKESKQQIQFTQRTEFHLISNKSHSASNKFIDAITKFQDGEIEFNCIDKYIKSLENKTTDVKIKSYIQSVLQLSPSVLEKYLLSIYFELELDDIIERVKRSIYEKIIDVDKVDAVFERLDSNIRSDNFIAIKQGKSIQISFEQFMERYRKIFDSGRSKKLVRVPFSPVIPNDIFGQQFIKRLLEINDISVSDEEIAVDYTKHKLCLIKHLEAWVQTGDLVTEDVDALHDEVFQRWRNEFRFAFHKCKNLDEVIDSAITLLTNLRKEYFKVSDSQLDTILSNGELYYLSDIGRIGWHKNWESL